MHRRATGPRAVVAVRPSALRAGSASVLRSLHVIPVMFPAVAPVLRVIVCGLATAIAAGPAAAPVHADGARTTYLWHMHQPYYWPDRSTWEGERIERAYETILLGHSRSDVFEIFDKDDRVAAYQWAPRDAVQSILDLPYAGAQLSFAGSLIDNVRSLGENGWNGGRYASDWYRHYREAMSWTDAGGLRRVDAVLVGAHHAISPLMDENAFRMEIRAQKAAYPDAWGGAMPSRGFFPAEMCFSERMIPTLVEEGVEWALVPDVHISRACADYPADAILDLCDPPNRADQVNPAQGYYYAQSISRGITTRVPPPYGFTPHRALHVDPVTGVISTLVVVPVAMGMSWNEGLATYGTGEIDAIAAHNNPSQPMLVVFAHDGDNHWAGGYSYYYENVTQFAHAAAAQGYVPGTIQRYLSDYPVDPADVVHVEDGGWVNADGDFGSPQYINWNWPLHDAAGSFDIPDGWALDQRNWAVLTAAQNRVETAEAIAGPADPMMVWNPEPGGPGPGGSAVDRAWHFLLAGYESGYMYYGNALDFEVKPTLACNQAVSFADPIIAGGVDQTPPTVWLPQRLPWNPVGFGAGSLWGYPGGQGAPMPKDFFVWTFAYDVSGIASATLRYRLDADGVNPIDSIENETYAGGPGMGAWQALEMTHRAFPAGNVHGYPDLDFFVMPDYIADEYWVQVEGLEDVLVDYHVEVVDGRGLVKRSPIQHVYVGIGDGGTPGGPAVNWIPGEPVAGGQLAITYDAVPGALPDGTSPVHIHIGHSGWQNVLTPDPPMTDNGDSTHTYVYDIPTTATSVDFVFNDGAGTWDNNGGADWHVPVSGGAPPGFVLDGNLDPGASQLAFADGFSVYADWNGTYLYVATEPVALSGNGDHFLFVAVDRTGTAPAPWAKSGTVAGHGYVLGNEDDNGWAGWFGYGGEPDPGGAGGQAVGSMLEGTLALSTLLGAALPDTVWLAVGHYRSPDGGLLVQQVPGGDGDGNIEAPELVALELGTVVGVPPDTDPGPPGAGAGPGISVSPNPLTTWTRIELALVASGAPDVAVYDVGGRRVRRLLDGVEGVVEGAGSISLLWDARDEAGRLVAPGVYVIRVSGRDMIRERKIAVIR